MGVTGLWKIFDDVKQKKSLLKLAAEHRARAQTMGIGGREATFTVGVDMGTCMAECNGAAHIPGVNYQQPGGGLFYFFGRLTEFLKAPVALVFVLDGPARPSVKRGHEVRHKPIWWTDLAIELLEAFGHQVHRAPGEAEAELAKLNAVGYIHAVISSDSDTLIYGTPLILRNLSQNDREFRDEYSVYNAKETPYPLTQGGIVLFALLVGGDYDNGLDGCGSAISEALAHCGFGDRLLEAYRSLHGSDFERCLGKWRCDIRAELLTNSQKFLSRRQFDLATEISYEFPDRRTLDLYMNPVTSWSPGRIPPDPSQWTFKQPSIPAIAQFCIQYLHWWDPQAMKREFQKKVWEGVFLQMLYSPSAIYSPEQRRLSLPPDESRRADILNISEQTRRGQYAKMFGTAPQPKLVVSTVDFVNSMGASFSGGDFVGVAGVDRVTVWPPASLLPQALRRQPAKKAKKPRRAAHRRNSGETTKNAATLQAPPQLHADSASLSLNDLDWIQMGENQWYVDLTSD